MKLTFICSYGTHFVPFHHSSRHDLKIPKSDYPGRSYYCYYLCLENPQKNEKRKNEQKKIASAN